MDRRRAAGALLALAACIASSTAAPTANNQTALDLYDETTDGCYYNFQHYGEGDRIMTNEPCLNCTCHNRMLMCYLRVCPFTKAIGQDCTVEKRADQCCPIVTCPDVPVDLLTSTSTSSPAEYGGTGIGKVDKYGCTINGKYFSEGAKVPPTPGKPCEHCYCIRNMTTCVMQECTLHVDGCTPIYHKDVCCPVRYYCDHPEDEMPLLDDMTTTVRPTPGFLLTTVAPTEPPTTAQPARRDCIEDDQLYPDGALIKTEKPCEHCYCMKGDIVCVVQECGTPMENEGKNCSSLPPREGQCCPDTYICEGDELSTEVSIPETHFEEPVTTIAPPRRASVEGSGYRNEPDEIPYTEVPTFATEMEGSGEEELAVKPEQELTDKFGTTEEAEFIPLTTPVSTSEQAEKVTTEPDKGLNTVPSGILEDKSTESALGEKTTSKVPLTDFELTGQDEQTTTPFVSEQAKSSEPSLETTTTIYDIKVTEPTIREEATESIVDLEKESLQPLEKDTTPAEKEQAESFTPEKPETYITIEPVDKISSTIEPSATEISTGAAMFTESVPSVTPSDKTQEGLDVSASPTTVSIEIKTTASSLVKEKDETLPSDNEGRTTISYLTDVEYEITRDERKTTVSTPVEGGETLTSIAETKTTVLPLLDEDETLKPDSRRTTSDLGMGTTPKVEEYKTEAPVLEHTTSMEKLDVTEPAIHEQNTVSVEAEADQSTEAPALENTTRYEEIVVTELSSTTKQVDVPAKPLEESSEQPNYEITTSRNIVDTSELLSTTAVFKDKIPAFTTKPILNKDEEASSTESDENKELSTSEIVEINRETTKPSEISTEKITSDIEIGTEKEQEVEMKLTTIKVLEQQEEKEATTESIMELSTFAHATEKELAATLNPETVEASTVAVSEKVPPQIATINPEENEIAEVASPGRIPGEGDCLLEGTTYQNDSFVPSINKCHSGCKCVSSIIKCDPIICSSPPEDMENCQPRYDTPEACCPTYVCDHGMETIPPQSESHITGTESPTPSTIECHSADCERHDDRPSVKPPQIPEKMENDCGSTGCDQTIQSSAQPCTEDQCEVLQSPKEQEKPQEIPYTDNVPPCANPDDCKDISTCDKEGGCIIKPDELPVQEIPQVCTSEEECKQVKIPQPESVPCEGESCTSVPDCISGECKIISASPQPSQQGEECSKENGCTDVQKEVDASEIICTGDVCMQQKPTSSTEETAHTVSIPTESPASEQGTSKQPIQEDKTEPSLSKLPTTLSESEVTVEPTETSKPNKEDSESPISDDENQVTKSPDEIVSSLTPEVTSAQPVSEVTEAEQKVTEISHEEGITSMETGTEIPQKLFTVVGEAGETAVPSASSAMDESKQGELGDKPTKEKTEHPEKVTESYDVHTDTPGESIELQTEIPKQQYDGQKLSTPILEESTKEPEMVDREQEPITRSPESSVTEAEESHLSEAEKETIRPQKEPEPVTVVALSEETTKLPETTESGKITESPIKQTENAEIPTSLEEQSTRSSVSIEAQSTTSSYEKELMSTVHVTEQQEDTTKVSKEDEEKRTTLLEDSSSKTEDETTTSASDTTQEVLLEDTKQPESEEKYTTESPTKPTLLDELVPTEHISVDEIPDKHEITTEVPEPLEIITKVPHADTDQTDILNIDVQDKITTKPQTTTFEKETESSVTESSHPASMVTESLETPEVSSATTSKDEEHDAVIITTSAPEFDVTGEAASPFDTEKIPQQATTVQQLPEESITEKQLITEIPISSVTETTKPSVIDQQSSVIPPSTDSEVFASQEPVTYTSVAETPDELEKTTSLPSEQATIGEKVQEVTESNEPTISKEHEMSTDAPESPEEESQNSVAPEQETQTKEPEFYITVATQTDKPIEGLEEVEKELSSEKPITDVKKEVTTYSTENILPVMVTESQELPEKGPEKRVTTRIPISNQEKPDNSDEFVTQQTFTESPESTAASVMMHHEPTITTQLFDSEPQKPSIDQSVENNLPTIIPDLQPTEQYEMENEPRPELTTSIPELPSKEAQTGLPEVQKTTASIQTESASPEISEITTVIPKIDVTEQEEKQTEQPISLVTEPKPYTSTEPKDEFTAGQNQDNLHKKEEPTEHTPENIPEITKSPIGITTRTPVLEGDKQPEEPAQTSKPEIKYSETTPYLVELEEHTHKIDVEEPSVIPSGEPTITSPEEPSINSSEQSTSSAPPVTVSSGEPTSTLSEKTTSVPFELSTSARPEEFTVIPPQKPTLVQLEESTVAPAVESTVSLLGEPTIDVSEKQTVASSEEPSIAILEEMTTKSEMHTTDKQIIETVTEKLGSEEIHTELPENETERPSDDKELVPVDTKEPHTTETLQEMPEKVTESIVKVESTSEVLKPTDELFDKYGSPDDNEKGVPSATLKPVVEDEVTTSAPSIETEKPSSAAETEKVVTAKPQIIPAETTAPEEEFIPVTTKITTSKPEEEAPTELSHPKPEDKPSEPASTAAPEISKPDEMQPIDEIPSPEDDSHFPPSGGYNQEPDYVEEDQAFGPGTCRYGGKVYVSAQQIPRDDPCDFCFCFRSDIICLQQSCPPPIHGCHEEPIQGFCCPRYECPVSMATTLNVTTTTTTTTTTLPPHFLPHAYKGAATRKGCQIKGHTYQVGEVVRASSGPCLHCTCGGDGQMKCDPKQCTPEPMLRQMIAAAVSSKRRR